MTLEALEIMVGATWVVIFISTITWFQLLREYAKKVEQLAYQILISQKNNGELIKKAIGEVEKHQQKTPLATLHSQE